MGTSKVPQPESSARSRAWSNPYKFRLWLGTLDHELLNDRQKRELVYFTGWGPKGCDDWNYKLELEFHCSKRTIRNDLRHLEKHALVDIRGALGKHRRIITIPYPTKSSWMASSLRETSQKLGEFWSNTGPNRGAKFCPHERRTSKTSINQQLDGLLYGETFLRLSGGGSSETSALELPYEEAQVWESTRRKIIDQLVREGNPRDSAITMANIVIRTSIRQKQSVKKKSPGLPNPARP
ncbi:hypothetical protein ES703_79123 [subsurface metagenome]